MPECPLARITGCSYNLFHAPYFSRFMGTTPAAERAANADAPFLKKLDSSMRSYESVVYYPPNQSFIGNLDPRKLPPEPWYGITEASPSSGAFGDILSETVLYALIKYSDVFGLVLLTEDFSRVALSELGDLPAMKGAVMASLEKGSSPEEVNAAVQAGAFPLYLDETLVGCVKAAHPTDINMSAHIMVENLAAKATAVYALRHLVYSGSIDTRSIGYIIETSEEACGDMNQRGGGNFAKSIGELADLSEAGGSDTRSFCAGPVHGIMQASSLVAAGTFEQVVVVAGGTTAKLAMNAKKHLEKGLPVLEDVMGSFALLVRGSGEDGLRVRTDTVGIHKIGAGSAPQAVVTNLVADPLEKAGFSFSDIDVYAPELHNPEITGNAGAGNVTLQNMKMIAAMAVMKNQLAREDLDSFIKAHGVSGWAPTQGHIPSGVPALGWFMTWAKEGTFQRGMVIGKGSLFLGRMTNLFDGVSLIVEADYPVQTSAAKAVREPGADRVVPGEKRKDGEVTIGCTVTGAETEAVELERSALNYKTERTTTNIRLYGEEKDRENHRLMDEDLEKGRIDGALTFHYPFPIGTATVGLVDLPDQEKRMFIATTTGATSVDRVEALVLNALAGQAAAKAWGIPDPSIGFLNLEGAASALKAFRALMDSGYPARLAVSSRNGDGLLRGNDILKGSCDVLVCDSLTGNAVVKLLGAYDSAGEVETTGAGYGCGLSHGKPVGIISRATSGKVMASALEYLEKMIRGCWHSVLEEVTARAREAGLEGILKKGPVREAVPGKEVPEKSVRKDGMPEKVPVDAEIEGVDVLTLEEAVDTLLREGIYCEPGMGCTGPVIMVAKETRQKAKRILTDRSFL